MLGSIRQELKKDLFFAASTRGGNLMGDGLTEQAIYNVVVSYAER